MLLGYGLARSMFRGNYKANIVKHSGDLLVLKQGCQRNLDCAAPLLLVILNSVISSLKNWA